MDVSNHEHKYFFKHCRFDGKSGPTQTRTATYFKVSLKLCTNLIMKKCHSLQYSLNNSWRYCFFLFFYVHYRVRNHLTTTNLSLAYLQSRSSMGFHTKLTRTDPFSTGAYTVHSGLPVPSSSQPWVERFPNFFITTMSNNCCIHGTESWDHVIQVSYTGALNKLHFDQHTGMSQSAGTQGDLEVSDECSFQLFET